MREGLNKNMRELYNSWEYMKKVSFRPNDSRYEGVPCVPEWESFDAFVKDNWFRYYRAVVKWKNYKRVAPRPEHGHSGELKHKTTRFKRKVKELGFTKGNTVFTSPSDQMKYAVFTHKYMFEGQMLGTRDIKNILKKRGIFLNMESITQRLRANQDLFAPSIDCKLKWRGKFRSYVEIADMEDINYDHLKARHQRIDDTLQKAVDYCKQYDGQPTYEFEGQQLRRQKICEILSERTGLSMPALIGRFKKYGYDMPKLLMKFYSKEFGTSVKPVIATKEGYEKEFPSIEAAASELNLSAGNISLVCSGENAHAGGYFFMFKNGQNKELVGAKQALYLLNKKISEQRGTGIRKS